MRRTIHALGFALALACLWAGLSLGGRSVAYADPPPPTPTPTCPPGANCTNGTGGGGHQGG